MNRCRVCGNPGEKHHIIHKDEGGLEYPLNLIYLCEMHHRGPHGPHRDEKVDRAYKLSLQTSLKNRLAKSYYQEDKLRSLLKLSRSLTRTLVRTLKIHKEGYRNDEIIDFLMSGNLILDENDFLENE